MMMLGRLLGSNTPQYKGTAQGTGHSGGGLLGLITGLFGGGAGTPGYTGVGQPGPSGSGFSLFPQTPNYARAVAVANHSPAPSEEPQPSAGFAPEGGAVGDVEPQGKTITIIVKPGPGTSVEEVVQFLQDRVLDD